MTISSGPPRRWAALTSAWRGFNVTLLAYIALPLVIILGVSIRLGFTQIHEFQEALLKNDLDLVARSIQGPVSEALERGEPEAVVTALQSIFSIDRVYGASVFDREGQYIASGGIAESDLSESAIPRLLATTGEKQESYRQIRGREVFSHFMPLFDQSGQANGFLQITRRHDDFTRSLQILTLAAWGLWLVLALVIVVALLLGHYGGIGRHVERLLSAMARISEGDTRHRVAVTGPQEIRAVGAGLNRMLDAMQSSEAQLQARRQEQYRLQQQLNEADKMAAVGRTSRGFAHELGAPLSVIDGRARRLERRGGLQEDSIRDLQSIRKQVQYLTTTVRQLLDFSRAGHGHKSSFSSRQLVRRVQAAVDTENTRRSLQFEPVDDWPLIHGDPEQLSLALLNVIRNALQASHRQVMVAVDRAGEWVRITVTDDGDGLPDVPVEQLLEPFYTTKASGKGTGLGLAITANILRDHGGSLELVNRPEGGCRVVLVLPATAAAAAVNRQEAPYEPG